MARTSLYPPEPPNENRGTINFLAPPRLHEYETRSFSSRFSSADFTITPRYDILAFFFALGLVSVQTFTTQFVVPLHFFLGPSPTYLRQ